MNRKEVLDIYIRQLIGHYSEEEREDSLFEVWGSNWSGVEGWDQLAEETRKSIKGKKLPDDFMDEKYDEVLFFKLRDRCKGYRNEYLSAETGLKISSGKPEMLDACPCCGYRTLEERYVFEICTVCWWEDDGQDNEDADTARGGPNYGISLSLGRLNFIRHGIYDPKRKDLIAIKDEPAKFERGRIFEIEGAYLIEKGSDWRTKILR